nr:uncharacterized protein LOC120975507 [Aegilops tauschii subsp. strangulata]
MDERERPSASASSRAPNGHRAIWKIIWGCPAPPKVRVFAWRLVSNSLATWANKFSRHIELTDVCPICGVEQEDGFHTMCRCPLAKNLWHAMARDWPLPKIEEIRNTGPEWLFSLLEPLSDMIRMVVLMTMWRAWHVRNELTHGKEAPRTEASRCFLHGYISSLVCIQQHPHGSLEKGKMVLHLPATKSEGVFPTKQQEREELSWARLPAGWAKLNTDGSFVMETGEAGGGMVLWDDTGAIIYTTCREIFACDIGLEAKLLACREGVELALHRTQLPFVELDCAEAVMMIKSPMQNRSKYTALVQDIKGMIAESMREIVFAHISRSQNKVAHGLAAYGRCTPRTAVWCGFGDK